MSDEVTNPLYGKFEEVVDALVKPKSAPEADAGTADGQGGREGRGEGYGEEEERKARPRKA